MKTGAPVSQSTSGTRVDFIIPYPDVANSAHQQLCGKNKDKELLCQHGRRGGTGKM